MRHIGAPHQSRVSARIRTVSAELLVKGKLSYTGEFCDRPSLRRAPRRRAACVTSVLYTSVRVCEAQCSERDEACEGEAKPRALLRSWSALFARWSAVCSSKSKKQVLSLTALAVRNSVPPFRGRFRDGVASFVTDPFFGMGWRVL